VYPIAPTKEKKEAYTSSLSQTSIFETAEKTARPEKGNKLVTQGWPKKMTLGLQGKAAIQLHTPTPKKQSCPKGTVASRERKKNWTDHPITRSYGGGRTSKSPAATCEGKRKRFQKK